MAKKIALVDGVPKMVDETPLPAIYDESYLVDGNSYVKSAGTAASTYISFASPTTAHMYTGSFSFCLWVNPATSPPATTRWILHKGNAGIVMNYTLFHNGSTGRFAFSITTDGSTYRTVEPSGAAVTAGIWYFIVCRYDYANDRTYITVNNVTSTSGVHPAKMYTVNTFPMRLFGRQSGDGNSFVGSIDEVAFYDTLIDTTLMTWLYNSGTPRNYSELGPSEKTNLVSWYGFNEQSLTGQQDEHGSIPLSSDHDGLNRNVRYEKFPSIVAGSALKSTATGTNLVTFFSPTTSHNFTGSFSLCAWVKPSTVPPSLNGYVIHKGNFSTDMQYSLYQDTTTGRFVFRTSTTGADFNLLTSSVSITVNNWYFIVCRYDYSTDIMYITVNGTTDSRTPLLAKVFTGNTSPYRNMGRQTGDSNGFVGTIDEIALYNTFIDTTLMNWLYNSGTPRSYSELGASEKTGLVSWYGYNLQSDTGQPDEHGSVHLTSDHNGTTKRTEYDPPAIVYGVNGIGQVESGTLITLPSRSIVTPFTKTYGEGAEELEIWHNGRRLEKDIDYIRNSTTTIILRFDLLADDILRFRMDDGTGKLKLIPSHPDVFKSISAIPTTQERIYDQSINVKLNRSRATRFTGAGSGGTSGHRRLINTNSIFNFVNASFSGGVWVRPRSTIYDSTRLIFGKGSSTGRLFQIRVETNNTFRLHLSSTGSNDIIALNSVPVKTRSVWHFVAFYYDYNNDVAGISVNGSQFKTTSVSSKLYATPSSEFWVSAWDDITGNAGLNDIESIFMRSGVITDAQLNSYFSKRHYSEFTVGDKTNLISYWSMGLGNATHNDLHGTNHLTVAGAGPASALSAVEDRFTNEYITNRATKFNGGGVGVTRTFDISNAVATSAGLNFSTSFSGCAWVNINSLGTTENNILGMSGTSAGQFKYRLKCESGASKKLQFRVSDNGTTLYTVTHPTAIVDDWCFVVFYWDSVAGDIGISVNNSSFTVNTAAPTTLHNTTAWFWFGGHGATDPNGYNGSLDEVIIFDGIVGSPLITKLYNGGAYGVGYAGLTAGEKSTIVSSWKMDNGDSANVVDQDGTANGTGRQGTGAVTLVNGVVNKSTITVPANTSITLPLGGTYDHTSDQLEVYLNGQRLERTTDYVQTSTTQIQLTFDLVDGDNLKFRVDKEIVTFKELELVDGIRKMTNAEAPLAIYDQTIGIVASSPTGNELIGPIVAGVDITLPAAQTYDDTSEQLEVYLNGLRMEVDRDYNQVSTTQIEFVFDIVVGDSIRFRIDRNV